MDLAGPLSDNRRYRTTKHRSHGCDWIYSGYRASLHSHRRMFGPTAFQSRSICKREAIIAANNAGT